jgi:hypothetical protein
LVRACRENAGRRSNKEDHVMETNILQIKRKPKNEMGRQCYVRYSNHEDQELDKDCHE